MRLGFDPRRRYLTGPPPGSPSAVYRKRRLLAAFDPRVRYLRGLGDDTAIPVTGFDTTDVNLLAPSSTWPTGILESEPQTQPLATLPGLTPVPSAFLPNVTTLFTTPSTAASLANQPASGAAASTSWWSQKNPTLGISNGWLAGGVGAIAALVLLSGGKRR